MYHDVPMLAAAFHFSIFVVMREECSTHLDGSVRRQVGRVSHPCIMTTRLAWMECAELEMHVNASPSKRMANDRCTRIMMQRRDLAPL
jgi:hypothetical protein